MAKNLQQESRQASNRADIKPGKEKLFQAHGADKAKGTSAEEEFKEDAVARKYSKEPGNTPGR